MGNHHEKLGLKRVSCATQFTIPVTADMSPDPVGNYTNMRSFNPNRAMRAPDFSYPLVSSILFPSASPSLLHIHNSSIITEHIVNSSLTIAPCHNHKFTLSSAYTECSIQRVQHTPSSAYTKYSIHQVQHTPTTAYTNYSIHQVQHAFKIVCVPFILTIPS
jgi:hypothetical protein